MPTCLAISCYFLPFLVWDPNSADKIWNSAAPTGRGLRQQPADLSDMKKKVVGGGFTCCFLLVHLFSYGKNVIVRKIKPDDSDDGNMLLGVLVLIGRCWSSSPVEKTRRWRAKKRSLDVLSNSETLMKLNTEHRISGFGELFLLDMVICEGCPAKCPWFFGEPYPSSDSPGVVGQSEHCGFHVTRGSHLDARFSSYKRLKPACR